MDTDGCVWKGPAGDVRGQSPYIAVELSANQELCRFLEAVTGTFRQSLL